MLRVPMLHCHPFNGSIQLNWATPSLESTVLDLTSSYVKPQCLNPGQGHKASAGNMHNGPAQDWQIACLVAKNILSARCEQVFEVIDSLNVSCCTAN
jgi:hypothetical protein